MAFEKFVEVGKSFKPRISIRSNGQFGFTTGAINKFKLRDFKYAVLFFDRDTQKIGIMPTNNEEEGACRIVIRSTNAFISARAFLDYYGIDYLKTKRYDAEWAEGEGMIIIQGGAR